MEVTCKDKADAKNIKNLVPKTSQNKIRTPCPKMDIPIQQIPQTTRKYRPPQKAHPMEHCTPKNKIILNTVLIEAPTGGIDHVIVHELCHFVHQHTAKFMNLQTK